MVGYTYQPLICFLCRSLQCSKLIIAFLFFFPCRCNFKSDTVGHLSLWPRDRRQRKLCRPCLPRSGISAAQVQVSGHLRMFSFHSCSTSYATLLATMNQIKRLPGTKKANYTFFFLIKFEPSRRYNRMLPKFVVMHTSSLWVWSRRLNQS